MSPNEYGWVVCVALDPPGVFQITRIPTDSQPRVVRSKRRRYLLYAGNCPVSPFTQGCGQERVFPARFTPSLVSSIIGYLLIPLTSFHLRPIYSVGTFADTVDLHSPPCLALVLVLLLRLLPICANPSNLKINFVLA